MKAIVRCTIALFIAAIFFLLWTGNTQRDVVSAQGRAPVYVYRFYTGSDNLSHVEKIDAKFVKTPNETYNLMAVTGAELHRSKPGGTSDWHPGPRRQYIINLSGQAELEVAGGVKVELGPGTIELIEDTHGKGHITRTLGTEDRVSLWLPIADQTVQ